MVLCIVNVKQYESNLSLQLKTSSQNCWLQIFISHLEQKLGRCVTYMVYLYIVLTPVSGP